MAKTKTTYTGQDVVDFVNSYVDNEQKKNNSFQLIERMQEWTNTEPKIWGPTIIGFGTTITNMQADTKEMHQFLVFLQEKQPFLSTFILTLKEVKY